MLLFQKYRKSQNTHLIFPSEWSLQNKIATMPGSLPEIHPQTLPLPRISMPHPAKVHRWQPGNMLQCRQWSDGTSQISVPVCQKQWHTGTQRSVSEAAQEEGLYHWSQHLCRKKSPSQWSCIHHLYRRKMQRGRETLFYHFWFRRTRFQVFLWFPLRRLSLPSHNNSAYNFLRAGLWQLPTIRHWW